jgi:hypothetical protein
MQRAGEAAGLAVAAEGFADRAYEPDGSLTPRTRAGSVIHDAETVVARAARMATEGVVTATDGRDIPMRIATLCVHGDTPGAGDLARALREGLTRAGVDRKGTELTEIISCGFVHASPPSDGLATGTAITTAIPAAMASSIPSAGSATPNVPAAARITFVTPSTIVTNTTTAISALFTPPFRPSPPIRRRSLTAMKRNVATNGSTTPLAACARMMAGMGWTSARPNARPTASTPAQTRR